MLEAYHQHVADRAKLGISPLPLNAQQTAELCEILKNPPEELKGELLTLNEVLELSDTNPYAKQVFVPIVWLFCTHSVWDYPHYRCLG